MKIVVRLSLSFILIALPANLRAEDSPAQAAARAALQQTLNSTNAQGTVASKKLDAWLISMARSSTNSITNNVPKQLTNTVSLPTFVSASPKPTNSISAAVAPKQIIPRAVVKPVMIPDETLSTNVIMSAAGSAYSNAIVDRVERDGIVVSYRPPGGGLAIIKIGADNLPHDLRVKYGFEQAASSSTVQK